MALFRPFQAVRPQPEYVQEVAALPYDVMTSDEARVAVIGKPYSFLHVDKAEIDLDPSMDPYDEKVYRKARENLDALRTQGICAQDAKPMFYLYRQVMNGRSQTGLVGCASVDDYLQNKIKKHEFTRADKEADRIRHVDICDANTGPIFLTYKDQNEINAQMIAWQSTHEPVYNFTAEDEVAHTVWILDDDAIISTLQNEFSKVDSLYIADGHHRAASAVKVGCKRREQNPMFTGEEEFNFFLAVVFPESELAIMDYNRVIKDLNALSVSDFLAKVAEQFTVTPFSEEIAYRPGQKHTFGMFLDDTWYKLAAKPGTFESEDPVLSLDVSILQNNLIAPVLGIDDPRTSSRIDFVGGIRGLRELERRVHGDMMVAFSMYPTTIKELMAIADAGHVMPPKSTWFEPKLLSGLFIHLL